jgi:hypothetical protein
MGEATVSSGARKEAPPDDADMVSHVVADSGWRMLSVPGAPESVAARSGNLVLYSYDTLKGSYIRLDDIGIEEGRAYFIRASSGMILEARTRLSREKEVFVNLKAGWNAVGNPFDKWADLSLARIQLRHGVYTTLNQAVNEGIIQPPMTVRDGRCSIVDIDGTLESWAGLWIYAEKELHLLFATR